MDNLLVLATAAGSVAKVGIDILRMGRELPPWMPPTLSLAVSPILVFLFLLSTDAESLVYSWSLLATCLLSGILAAGYSVGATELARRGDKGPEA